MTYQQIASLIPAEYRTEILSLNAIATAQPVTGNPMMIYLGEIWKAYVNPQQALTCGACLETLLNNYRELQPVMMEMEKAGSLLDLI